MTGEDRGNGQYIWKVYKKENEELGLYKGKQQVNFCISKN